MASLASYYASNLIGFFSYSREDDSDFNEVLSKFRFAIQAELSAQLGRNRDNFRVWQDKVVIPHGTLWQKQITEAINQSAFFIPIISPRVVNSPNCAFEFEAFLARERELGRDDLVFPILYIQVPELDDGTWQQSPVLKVVKEREYLDWRNFRYRSLESPEVAETIGRFCRSLTNALRKSWLTPEERQQQLEAAAQQKAAEEQRRKAAEIEALKALDDETRREAAEAARIAEEAARREKERVEAQQREAERRRQQEALVAQRAEEERALMAAKRIGTVAAFDDFLNAHASGILADEARKLREASLARQEAHGQAMASVDCATLRSFCKTYQKGADVDEVRARLKALAPSPDWKRSPPAMAASIAGILLLGGAVFWRWDSSNASTSKSLNLPVAVPLPTVPSPPSALSPKMTVANNGSGPSPIASAPAVAPSPNPPSAPSPKMTVANNGSERSPIASAPAVALSSNPPSAPSPKMTVANNGSEPSPTASAPAGAPSPNPSSALPPKVAATNSGSDPSPVAAPVSANPTPPAVKTAVCHSSAQKADFVGDPLTSVTLKLAVTPKQLRSIAISPNGQTLVTAADDGVIRIWDVTSLRLMRQLPKQAAAVYSVAFSDDGKLLASAGWDGTVRIWDTRSFVQQQVFTADSGNRVVPQNGVAFEPGPMPRYVNSAGTDGNVWIWHTAGSNAPIRRPSGDSWVRSLSFAPHGQGEFVSGNFDGDIKFFTTTKIDTVRASSGKVLHVAYSPDAKPVASAGVDTVGLKVWSATNHTLFKSYEGHIGYAASVAWSSDGSRIVSGGGKDHSVRLWNVQSGIQLKSFSGHTEDVEAVAFHPNQKWVISASEDGTMKLWDIANSKLLLSFAGYENGAHLAYAPNGCYTGSKDASNYVKFVMRDASGVQQDVTANSKETHFVPDDSTAVLLPQ